MSNRKVLGGAITVQSSKHGPDYLESRVNNFLDGIVEKGFSPEQVEAVKKSTIQNLKQVKNNLKQEISEQWDAIQDDNFSFDAKERLIACLEKVTPEQVNSKLREILSTNQRRLNIKLRSQNHPEEKQLIDGYYAEKGVSQEKIENVKLFRMQSTMFPKRKN